MKQIAIQRKFLVGAAVAALGLSVIGVGISKAADKDSDITVIMKKAFKAPKKTTPPTLSMVKKAVDGTASKDELTSLLGYAKELQKAKPPKGEQKDWDDRTGAMVTATEGLLKGDKSAAASMKTASNCKECHKLHQPE